MEYAVKILLTSIVVVAVSELGKRYSWAAAILASLPLTSLLALTWIYVETKNAQAVINLSLAVFWMVIPSLVFFLVLPLALKKGLSYWPALVVAGFATFVGYSVFFHVLKKFGIAV